MRKKDLCFLVFTIAALFFFSMVPLVHNVNAETPQLTFGSLGGGPGQFNIPRGIAVDESGNIYVADNRNHRVEKFDSSGSYLSSFDIGSIPEGIAVDRSGNINVVDRNSMSVEKFSPTGTLLSSFGSAGSAAGQLGNAERIVVDSSGNIYVTDVNVIQKFNSKGIFMSQFFANDTNNCCMNAMGIAIDSSNNIYVADMFDHRIIKFNSTGSILSVFNASSVPRISSTPQDVAVDTAGNIYVADTDNGRIVKLDTTGHPLSTLEISGVPVGIAVRNDKIYATDLGNNRVDVFLSSQFVNNNVVANFSSTHRKEIPLGQNSTALDAAIKLATSSPQFQSLVMGYNYTFTSDFEESGPLSSGGIGLTAHGFAFELYSGPVIPGKAEKVVEVMEDPSLAKILNVTSYPAVYNGPAISSATPANPPGSHPQNNTLLSPLKQFKSGVLANNVTCNQGLELIFKAEDGSPACVKPTTAQKLVERGWGTILSKQEPFVPIPQVLPNGTSIIVLTEGQRYGPLLVQTISVNSVGGLDFREYPLATNVGYPITLHIGDIASNGCTIELELAKINGTSATFVLKEYKNRPCPICLSENTAIETPTGPLNVKALRVGMPILTQDASGHKITAIILKTGRTLVPPDHKMVHLILADKRELYVSPNHPTVDGRLFGELSVGDSLDDSKIKSIEVVPYNGTYTYDILPSGKTGFYWANGILVGSTLK